MKDTNYIVAGINVVKCEYCGFDHHGKPRKDGGNVFIKIGLKLYERVRHDCFLHAMGKCRKCGRMSLTEFVHPAAPKASEETIRALSHAVMRNI